MKLKYKGVSAMFAGILALGLSACGGGGGSGGGIDYTGSEEPAAITDQNKQVLVESTVVGSGPGNAIGALSADDTATNTALPMDALVGTIANVGNSVIHGIHGSNFTATATQSASDTISGTCGGSAGFNIQYDDQSGDFSGSITFNNYDECDGVVNGRSSFSGQLSGGGSILDFRLSFSSLSYSDDTQSFDISGSMSYDGSLLTTTIVYRDNVEETVYRVEDFVITDYGSSIGMSGRFYHPDHGYVDVSTPTPIGFTSGGVPSSGVVLLQGNNSAARATFSSGGSYTVETDLDGDGTYEGTHNCSWDTECTAL